MNEYYYWTNDLKVLENKLSFSNIRSHGKASAIPAVNVLIGPEGSGKHSFIRHNINQIVNQENNKWHFINYRINNSSDVVTEYFGNKQSEFGKVQNKLIGIVQQIVCNTSFQFGPISFPTIDDIFPNIPNTNEEKLMIVFEIDDSDSILTNWIIDFFLKQNTQDSIKYLLVISNPDKIVRKKLQLISGNNLLEMPSINEKQTSIDVDTTDYDLMMDAVDKAGRVLHTNSKNVLFQYANRPGIIFALSEEQEDNYEIIWNRHRSELKKQVGNKKYYSESDYNLIMQTLKLVNHRINTDLWSNITSNSDLSQEIWKYLSDNKIIITNDNKSFLNPIYDQYISKIKSFPKNEYQKIERALKECFPQNYYIRSLVKKENEKNDNDELYISLRLLNELSYVYETKNTNDNISKIFAEEIKKIDDIKLKSVLQLSSEIIHNIIFDNQNKSREKIYTLVSSARDVPILLKAKINLLSIQLAKQLRISNLVNTLIINSIELYKNLAKNNEYDLQMQLGLEISADIRNYNLDRYYLESDRIFSDLRIIVNNSNINWPNYLRKNYKLSIVKHEGIINELEPQNNMLKEQLSELSNNLSEFDRNEKMYLLTNIVGIDLNLLLPQKEDENLYKDDIENLNDSITSVPGNYKAINNLVIGKYLTSKSGSVEAIKIILEECYDNQNFDEIWSRPITNTSHKIIHMNLALLAYIEDSNNLDKSKKMLSLVINNAPQDDFYRFYINYNNLILDLIKGKFKNSDKPMSLLRKLKIPALFDNTSTGDNLYRRLNYLESIIDGQNNFKNLQKVYENLQNEATWIGSILDRNIFLFSDLQFWD